MCTLSDFKASKNVQKISAFQPIVNILQNEGKSFKIEKCQKIHFEVL